jgi:glycosyltransferase involved in cell wall biosynthesis
MMYSMTPTEASWIRVGLTEAHGMANEVSQFPPAGVAYSFLKPIEKAGRWLRSPIKGFMRDYAMEDYDLIEAILSPLATDRRWILSLSNFQEAVAFSFLGLPLPLALRTAYIKSLLLKDNCKRVIFWSQAGKETLRSYANVTDERLFQKIEVIYPAVRRAPDECIRFSSRIDDAQLLFSGYFFRKGGVNVVDAFERLQKDFPKLSLRLCCSEEIDFATPNHAMKQEYLRRIRQNPGITMARATREELVHTLLPNADIFLVPTYVETFGFAILEAMAFGLPIISTNHFAIPEMIRDGQDGLLIDTQRFDCDRLFRGYTVNTIPDAFREHVTTALYQRLRSLIENPDSRKQLGLAAVKTARSRFSFETRNDKMSRIYREAMA